MLKELLGLSPSMAAAIVGMYLLMGTLEIFAPAEKGHTWSGRFRNFTYTLIYLSLGTLALKGLKLYLPKIAPQIHHYEHPIAFAFVYILVTDFFYYWYHRLQHRWPVLWRIHELHHSDAEVNITTSLRTHWLEKPVQHCAILIPTLFIVGLDIRAIFWWAMIGQLWEMFTHANINCFPNRLATVLCNPSIHRLHHSRLKEHHQCNFAQYFTVYDMIFGTYIAPSREARPPTGTTEIPSDYSIFINMFRPFLRHKSVEQVEVRPKSRRAERRSKK